jgi:hypothetical protein
MLVGRMGCKTLLVVTACLHLLGPLQCGSQQRTKAECVHTLRTCQDPMLMLYV